MIYRIARALVTAFLALFNNWSIEGRANLPEEGPVVLVANHISNWDPLYVACSVKRVVHFMAKEELFKNSFSRMAFNSFQCFPVKRGKVDRNALRLAAAYLENGEVLGMFPEGTRSKTAEMLPFQPGAAMFALRSNALIVPVALEGTRTSFPATLRGKVRVLIGEPLVYPELSGAKINGEDLQKVTDEIVASIRKMLAVKA